MQTQQFRQKLLKITSDDLIFYCVALTFFLLPTGTAPPLISIGLACLVWIASGKIFQIKMILKQPWFYPVIPFVILPWIGLLYSQNLDLGLDYALKTKYWMALFITAGVCLNPIRFDLILKWFWAGLLIGAFLAMLQFAGFMSPIRPAFLGFGIVHTLIGMYLVIGILTASFCFKKTESRKKGVALIFLILMFVFHLAVLKGRSGYLAFIVFSPFIANNLMHRFSLKFKWGLCAILVCLILLSPVVRSVIDKTVVTLKSQKESALKGDFITEMPRFFIAREAVLIILEHPLIGIGTGSITEPTKAKGHLINHPHNNILYMGTSFGIFGILACLWLFFRMFKDSWHQRETILGNFVLSTCAVLFLGGMFDTQILNTGTLLFLSLAYGFLNQIQQSSQQVTATAS